MQCFRDGTVRTELIYNPGGSYANVLVSCEAFSRGCLEEEPYLKHPKLGITIPRHRPAALGRAPPNSMRRIRASPHFYSLRAPVDFYKWFSLLRILLCHVNTGLAPTILTIALE